MSENVTSLEHRQTIKEGSVCRLKSGGPAMVVIVRKADMACCTWHMESGSTEMVWVPTCAIEIVK